MIITNKNVKKEHLDLPLGEKAKNLVRIALLAKRDDLKHLDLQTGDFAIVPPSELEKCKLILPKNYLQDYSQYYTKPTTPPQEIENIFRDILQTSNIDIIKEAYSYISDSAKAAVRTSIDLDEKYSYSFAGVSKTVFERTNNPNFVLDYVSKALAGVWTFYADWYLSRRGLAKTERNCSLIFSKYIPSSFGKAHIVGQTASIHLGLDSKEQEKKLEFDFSKDCPYTGLDKKIFDTLKFLTKEFGFDISEIEFLIGDDGKIYIVQVREVKSNKDLSISKNELIYIFEKEKIYDLTNTPNSIDTLNNIKIEPEDFANTTFLINYDNSSNSRLSSEEKDKVEYLDTMSLILYLYKKYPEIKLNVIGVHSGETFISTHLTTALREEALLEDPLYNFGTVSIDSINEVLALMNSSIPTARFIRGYYGNDLSRM